MVLRLFIGRKIKHFSTFNKNYERRFKDTDLFEVIFKKILTQATLNAFIDSSNIFIDSTRMKASANKRKYNKIEVDVQAKNTKIYWIEKLMKIDCNMVSKL